MRKEIVEEIDENEEEEEDDEDEDEEEVVLVRSSKTKSKSPLASNSSFGIVSEKSDLGNCSMKTATGSPILTVSRRERHFKRH